MSRTRLLLAAICLLLFLTATLAFTLRSRLQASSQDVAALEIPRPAYELLDGYRKWTRVTPEPLLVSAQSAQLCAAVIPAVIPAGPHAQDKYISVYVNEIGRHAMMEEKSPHFPAGSIIVKEKLTTARSTTPELLTVMVKRDPDYNPENGDWEYMVFDGTGRTVQASGKLENCQSCHSSDQDTDYVSRAYLPLEVRLRLK
jgi:hypothetical protein